MTPLKKLSFLLLFPTSLIAQVFEFNEGGKNHRILMDDTYLIETVYQQEDGAFAFTRGGFFQKAKEGIEVAFEFNSNYAQDSIKRATYTQKDWTKTSKADRSHSIEQM